MFVIPDPSSVSKSPRPNPHGFSLFVFFHSDTTRDHDAVIVGDSRFLYVVQDLHSVLGLLHQKFDQHGQTGVPGRISDGSLLLRYGLRAKTGAKGRRSYPIPANKEGNEDRGKVHDKLPLSHSWKERSYSKISSPIGTYHSPIPAAQNPP